MPGSPPGDSHSLASALGPALRETCQGRLSSIEWFRSAWQRGGAATGFASWETGDDPIPVVVKLPVGPGEHRWMTAMGDCTDGSWHAEHRRCIPTPRVLAAGTQLGGHDLAWLVMERLPGRPLSHRVDEASVLDLLAAAADFQAEACRIARPEGLRPPSPNWEATLAAARKVAHSGGVPEAQKWNEAIHKVQKHLPALKARWEARVTNSWCHGDLHPGNALRRPDPPAGPAAHRNGCVLIDLALVHPGHWAEDALYLERQFWGHGDVIHGLKPLSILAKLRRERGLSANDHYAEIALVRRVLAAACAPALVEREGNPKYLHAALTQIEQLLPNAIK